MQNKEREGSEENYNQKERKSRTRRKESQDNSKEENSTRRKKDQGRNKEKDNNSKRKEKQNRNQKENSRERNYNKEEGSQFVEISFLDIEEENLYDLIYQVINKTFEIEKMDKTKLYINVILTNPENIKITNKKYRGIDKETDVLSFPMFEKEELKNMLKNKNMNTDILGDLMISIERVKMQAQEYGHSFKRELAYMLVHGFYHLIGYDHIEENEKEEMRKKEEYILGLLNIQR